MGALAACTAIGLTLAVTGWGVPAGAQAPAPDPHAILAAAKEASGGRAWDSLPGSREVGSRGATRYETWLDFRRLGMKLESSLEGVVTAQGFNGDVQWRRGPDGKVATSRDPAELREAVLTAYVSTSGYYFPDRFAATARYVRHAAEGGRAFDVVEVTPEGGRGAELWFDRKTHLLGRVVDRQGPQPVTVEISDYRKVGDVLVAFRGVVRGPDGRVLDEGRVETVEFAQPPPAAAFDPPSPASAR